MTHNLAQRYFKADRELYYTVNDQLDLSWHPMQAKRFYNKLDAVDAAKSVGAEPEDIFFHWFPTTWKNVDFTLEPTESYEQLKKERALKLRERYKYIRLFFSGGSDSITALNSFLKNGIHLDEIVNYKRGNERWRYMDPDNEVKLSARSYLDSIKHLIPNTKITYKSMSGKDLIEYNRDLDRGTDNIVGFGEAAEFELIPDHKHLCMGSDPATTCNLEGGQKPMLFLIDEQWYFGTTDVHNVGFYNNTEEFFFDPDDPRLFLKTVHRLKEFAQMTRLVDKEKFHRLFTQKNKLDHRRELLTIVGRDNVHNDISLMKFMMHTSFSPKIAYKDHELNYPYLKTYELVKNATEDPDLEDVLDAWFNSIRDIGKTYEKYVKSNRKEVTPVFGFKNTYSDFYNLSDGTSLRISSISKDGFITEKEIDFSCIVL